MREKTSRFLGYGGLIYDLITEALYEDSISADDYASLWLRVDTDQSFMSSFRRAFGVLSDENIANRIREWSI